MNPLPKPLLALIWSSLLVLALPVRGAVVAASFTSASTVPVTASGYSASGNTVDISLVFAAPVGTNLTVVNNTGLAPIQGTFDNLAQGQPVNLTFRGVTYPFVANYYGGTGNDLVLQWGNTRMLAWGTNDYGQLGDGTTTARSIPVPVAMTGALLGKRVTAVAEGYSHILALCTDGTVVGWGYNFFGQLGNNSTSDSRVPMAVNTSGVLAGKTVIALAAGDGHSLALCSDGTLAAWGQNSWGQLGNSTTSNSSVPVLVTTSGVLAGKRIIAIAAGGGSTLALCADGTLAAWGENGAGTLGNNTTTSSLVPVLVNRTGVLSGKTVVRICAGSSQYLVLCSDGTLAAWGDNTVGELGNNTTVNSSVPVRVSTAAALAGKTVTLIGTGGGHCLARCSDDTLVAWGYNAYGQLGNNSTSNKSVPVLVDRTGVLAGKTLTGIAGGMSHSIALCSDGTMTAWGAAMDLGNGATTNSSAPVLISSAALQPGECLVAGFSGCETSVIFALVASPPVSVTNTSAATAITGTGVTLNGSVNANGTTTAASFEYGLTTDYGTSVAATPASVSGVIATAVSATLSGLSAGATYHYRAVGTSAGGTSAGADMTFTTSTAAALASLVSDAGTLTPAFGSTVLNYTLTLPFQAATITLTPAVAHAGSTVSVSGLTVNSGSGSAPVALSVGNTVVPVVVTSADGTITNTYTVTVTRLPAVFAYDASSDVPVTTEALDATGLTASFELRHAPIPGTILTVINTTGEGIIRGQFANLAQGQLVSLEYAGILYSFVANYYGGSGNDLVLQWANTRLMGWGDNSYGQLGNNSKSSSTAPVAVDASGVLAGKTVIAVSAGSNFTLALCSDGTLAAWGENSSGQLGNNTGTNSAVPVAVTMTGALAGKTVTAIATGGDHCLVLCSDGTLAAWGYNDFNVVLGNNSTGNYSSVPVAVSYTGALTGKTALAIAAGGSHNLVLCSDGSLVTWGRNNAGQLGNNALSDSKTPVMVERKGVLANKSAVAIAAGGVHNVVALSDGTLAAWGSNYYGQLGCGTTTSSMIPVAVDTSGILAGKAVKAIEASYVASFAVCTDGTMAAWGNNASGQLGNNSATDSWVPVAVNRGGVLAGKIVAAAAAGYYHGLALCSDGTLAAWGGNSYGQLGNSNVPASGSLLPLLVNTAALRNGERFGPAGPAAGYSHSVAVVASPPPPVAVTQAASAITDTGVSLNGNVSANGSSTTVSIEFGLTTAYGTTVAAFPMTLGGTLTTAVSASLGGLRNSTTYHYRVKAQNAGGLVTGDDMTFSTTSFATLSDLTMSAGTLDPVFDPVGTQYAATVSFALDHITVSPVTAYPGATVTVNGTAVASGAPSSPVSLTEGDNSIAIRVTAADGMSTNSYSVTVTRVPQTFRFGSASQVGATVTSLVATGGTAFFELNFPPPTGTTLTVINNTGQRPITGTFDNLVQGQTVLLNHGGAIYRFVADYFGGTGNDLVLRWANTRVFAWGNNGAGQVGNGTTTPALVPVPVVGSGVLANKTVVAVAAGGGFDVALCADGTLATWGNNTYGQLGNNGNIAFNSLVPVAVSRGGVLANKTVVAIAAGAYHALVLCADGSLAAWGKNYNGELGNNAFVPATVPVAVVRSGVLANKQVIAVAAGGAHSLALCSDGTVAAWGHNGDGELGNNSTTDSPVPVLVDASGLLAGKRVVAITAGGGHSMALCSDGTLVAWGYNGYGELGNGSTNDDGEKVPVAVNRTGVLAGKTVTAIAGGGSHSLALCSDGTLAAWGYNYYGVLGNNSQTDSYIPVAVDRSGVLAGKTLVAVAAANDASFVLCSDGSLAAWGSNFYNGEAGSLGDNTTNQRNVPVLVSNSNLASGERFMVAGDGSISLIATPAAPEATTLAAGGITSTGAILNGSVIAAGADTAVSFEYGLTSSYGTSFAAVPATVSGTVTTAVIKTIGGLLAGTVYHFRVVASNPNGTTKGADMTFTTLSNNANLAALSLSAGTLVPGFDKLTTSYIATVPFATTSVTVTPTTEHPAASVKVNGVLVASGTASGPISLPAGNTTITILVRAEDSVTLTAYTLTVTRLPQSFVFNSASDMPVTANGFSAGGYPVTVILNYAPTPGTALTMVNNTGLGFICGTFSNLAQGQRITLTFNGTPYDFVANYYGASGNDLVLQWANTLVAGWGSNSYGQLGDTTTTRRLLPTPVDATGVLAGKTTVAVAEGYLHSLALCSDGTLAAWGYNVYGQLGNNSSASSSVPVAVDRSGVLAGKTVIAISAGPFHNLALCSDGTLVAWGYNNYGQLGTGDTLTSRVPARVTPAGALAGKLVVAVAAGAYHSFALCSDGTLAAWGFNDDGELGNGSLASSPVPVAVGMSGVLAGKRIASLSAGQYHTLARCTDSTLVTWGYNNHGQLGNTSTVSSSVPVAIGAFGALPGRTVVAIRAGGSHSIALCNDGTLSAWGWNNHGQLGVSGIAQSTIPQAIDMTGIATGTTVAQIAVGGNHSLALCASGTLAAWGDNASGELGNNSLTPSVVPVMVDVSGLTAGARCMLLASGSAAQHNLAVFGLPSGVATPHAASVQRLALDAAAQDAASALIAHAFGLDVSGEGALPQGKRVGDNYVIKFTEPAGVTGITYGAECSASLLPESWTEVPDSGTGSEHIFSVPLAGGQLFMRLKVTGQ